MENFDELKNLWQLKKSELPSAATILAESENARKKMLFKNVFAMILLVGTFIFITFIAFHYQFEMWTTIAGIIITLIAICVGILFNTSLIQLLLKKADDTLNNTSYLNQLKKIRAKQIFIHTKGITWYFVLLTTGILLYMVEFAKRDLIFGISVYAITLAWIAFNWFYLRKKTIDKQSNNIHKQIERIEKLIETIND
jgi:hypothetical protein